MKRSAVSYYRTSSAANIDGDSVHRQADAVQTYAKRARLDIVACFNDPAVSGADAIDTRPGFIALLDYCRENQVTTILVENASRFARDLAVQLTGHELLQREGIDLIPVDAPEYFTDPSPTAELVRQILGAVSQFEKASLVAKLRAARDRKRQAEGRCEGRKPVPEEIVTAARKLARRNRKNGRRRSLRQIAAALAEQGHFYNGKPYSAKSVSRML